MQPVHYEELASLDRNYWWFQVRFRYAARTVMAAAPDFGLLADIGCGAGGFLEHLHRNCAIPTSRLIGIEPDQSACDTALKRGLPVRHVPDGKIALAHLPRLADIICLLDVLEHIEHPIEALRGYRELVRPGGHVLVLVPALEMLWSRWDEHLGHFRRYTTKRLAAELDAAGWRPVATRYLFSAMVLPGLVRARLIDSTAISATEFPRVGPAVNTVLTRAFEAEARWLPLPFGTSVAALAKRD